MKKIPLNVQFAFMLVTLVITQLAPMGTGKAAQVTQDIPTGLTVEHNGRVQTIIPRSDEGHDVQWTNGITIHNSGTVPLRYWTSDSIAFIHGFPTLENERIEPGQSRNIPIFADVSRLGNGVYTGNQIIRYRVEGEQESAEVPIFYTFIVSGEAAYCTLPWLLTHVGGNHKQWYRMEDWIYGSDELTVPERGSLMLHAGTQNQLSQPLLPDLQSGQHVGLLARYTCDTN